MNSKRSVRIGCNREDFRVLRSEVEDEEERWVVVGLRHEEEGRFGDENWRISLISLHQIKRRSDAVGLQLETGRKQETTSRQRVVMETLQHRQTDRQTGW